MNEASESLRWIHRACPVCNGKRSHFIFRDRNRRNGYPVETNLVECKICGMRYLDPIPAPENWLDTHDEIIIQNKERRRTGFLIRCIDHMIYLWTMFWSPHLRLHHEPQGSGRGKRLLDIGCGRGDKLTDFQKREFEVYGIDVSQSAINYARQHVEGHFQIGTFEQAEYEPNFFDVIRFDNVLEHIYEPKVFLTKVLILLKPDGFAYGFVPNGIGPTMRWMKQYSINSWVPFHINLFTERSLKRLANEVGFDAEVKHIANPGWVALSARQFMNRKKKMFTEEKGWDTRFLMLCIAPFWWLLRILWQGEELALIARKPNSESA